MNKDLAVMGLAGTAIGAGLTYLFDPRRGRERRARVGDKLTHLSHEVDRAAGGATRDLRQRGIGLFAGAHSRLQPERADDERITERVRARLGHVCSHPSAIEVATHDGRVWLRGTILRSELQRTVRTLARVKGVREIDGDLAVYGEPGQVSSLQGGTPRLGEGFGLGAEQWSPAARFLIGLAGVGFVGYGLLRRGPVGLGSGLFGTLLTARSLTNLPLRRLTGVGAGPRAVDLIKTVYVDAPVEEVYAFWRAAENLPRFMSHVKSVRPLGGGRYYWEVEGPAGRSFAWEAEITKQVENRRLSWRSAREATVQSQGTVRFDRQGRGTRLQVQMSYNPPAGALGHELLKLLGADPRRQMHDDLLRFKALLERGKTTGRAGTAHREELRPM